MILAKLFSRNKSTASKGAKMWKQYEKRGIEAESMNALPEAKNFYRTALEEIQKIADGDTRHARYFAFKISQIRFSLERVESQLN